MWCWGFPATSWALYPQPLPFNSFTSSTFLCPLIQMSSSNLMLQVSLKLDQNQWKNCIGKTPIKASSTGTTLHQCFSTKKRHYSIEVFNASYMRRKLGILGMKWMCIVVKTLPHHWSSLIALFQQTIPQTLLFMVSVDADFQCEFNGHIFIQNDSETRTVGIFWISWINSICFILKRRNSPPDMNFGKPCRAVSCFFPNMAIFMVEKCSSIRTCFASPIILR